MPELVFKAIVIGIGATALMDLWAIFLNAAFKVPLPNWALAGRWFCGLTGGKVFHDDIAEAAPRTNELAIGWIGHYAIGLYGSALIVVRLG